MSLSASTGKFWLYVNSWGRDKKEMIWKACRRGISGTLLCMAEKDSVSEIAEVTHTGANPFQDFGFVITAFNKAVRPRDIHRIQDLVEPVAICLCAVMELRQLHDFHSE